MGARINYLFNQGAEEPAVWLYSHWGETDWQKDIALALQHSRSRWDDPSYGIRNIISKLIGNQWEQETGFGIGAVAKPSDFAAWDFTVEIDMINQSIDGHKFDEFIAYHLGLAIPVQ
jgi:hypothetical protein